MKHSAEYYIEHLEMEPHVEGGYFKECLLEKEERNLWSSIYFMLAKRYLDNVLYGIDDSRLVYPE